MSTSAAPAPAPALTGPRPPPGHHQGAPVPPQPPPEMSHRSVGAQCCNSLKGHGSIHSEEAQSYLLMLATTLITFNSLLSDWPSLEQSYF